MRRTRTTAAALGLLLVPLPLAGGAQAAEVPPAAPVVDGPALLTASSVRVSIATTDPTVTRLRWTRTSEGQAAVTREVAVSPGFAGEVRSSDLRDSGLQQGRTYTYAVSQVGPTGPSPAAAFSAVPTSRAPLGVSGLDLVGGVGRAAVSLRATGNAADTTTSLALDGVRITSDTSVSSFALPPALQQGETPLLRAIAHDRFGNATEGASREIAVPVDDPALARSSGTTRVARSGAYGTTSTVLTSRSAAVSIVTEGRRLQVLGERCPTCGELDVLVNGTRRARVDTRAATREVRQVLWTGPDDERGRTAVLTVRAVGTAGRPAVVVDAVGQRAGFGTQDAVRSGASLLSGENLQTAGATASLAAQLQRDGNLVVSRAPLGKDGVPVFQTRTRGAVRLTVQRDGNLVLVDRASRPLWQTGTAGRGPSVLVLQPDGNLVLRRQADGAATWSSRTGRLSPVAAPAMAAGARPRSAGPVTPERVATPGAPLLLAGVEDELTFGSTLQRAADGRATALLDAQGAPQAVFPTEDLAVSADGRRSVRSTGERLVAQGTAGGREVALDRLTSGNELGTHRELASGVGISPDGTRAVWRRETLQRCTVTSSSLVLGRTDGSGRIAIDASNGRSGLLAPVFLRDDLLLAAVGTNDRDDNGEICGDELPEVTSFVTIGLDGRTSGTVQAPDATTMQELVVNRAGTAVAYVRHDGADIAGRRYRIETAPLTVVGDVATIGTPTVLTAFAPWDDTDPHVLADGSAVAFRSTRPGGAGRLWTVPVTGGTATPLGPVLTDRRVGPFAVAG